MKKLILLALSTSLFAACQQSTKPAESNSGSDGELRAEIEAIKQDLYGGIIGNCPQTDWIPVIEDYQKSLDGLPSTELSSDDWHKANGERPGVMTSTSGLQYTIVREGQADSATPYPTDKVMVNYHGVFADGSIFDSAYQRGEPSEFQANRVIQGWVEALSEMKPCEARTLYIPGYLAYGPQGRKNPDGTYSIPPNATLMFHVQMLRIKRPALVQK